MWHAELLIAQDMTQLVPAKAFVWGSGTKFFGSPNASIQELRQQVKTKVHEVVGQRTVWFEVPNAMPGGEAVVYTDGMGIVAFANFWEA